MRAIVAKTAVVAAATGGLAASFLLPLAPHQAPAAPEEALRMPVATRETTVSVFPAPGRPESSPAPLERSQPPAAPRPSGPGSQPASPCGPALPRRSSHAPRPRRSGRRRTSASSRNSARSAPTTAAPGRSSPSSGFGTSPACEDVRVPLIRRPGPIGMALTAFEVWRRLPPEQRRQIMDATRKQAPRAAAAAIAYWRSRPPRRSVAQSRIRSRGSATREDP